MSMIQWLRDNYGWKAKRTEYTWLVIVAMLFVLLTLVAPVIYRWFQ